MIDRKQQAAKPAVERRELRDSIDQIARRLDELLRDMADVSPPMDAKTDLQAAALETARRLWRARRERDRIFGSTLAADPAWDILLDLFIAMGEGREVTVASVSAATGVPEPIVLRCIAHLVEAKLVARQVRPVGRDTMFLTLTERAVAMMSEFLDRTTIEAGVAVA
jgi:hypothetical protein